MSESAETSLPMGRFYNGQEAWTHHVELRIDPGMLSFIGPDSGPRGWPLGAIRLLPPPPNAAWITLVSDDFPNQRLRVPQSLQPALNAACPNLYRMTERDHVAWRIIGGSIAAAVTAFAILFMFVLPWTAHRIAAAVPYEAEARLGDNVYDAFMQDVRHRTGAVALCEAQSGVTALRKLRNRLIEERKPRIPLRLVVVTDDEVNAYALPGGLIILTSALLQEVRNEAELAGILAHEAAHIENRHSLAHAVQSGAAVYIVGLLVGDMSGALASSYVAGQLAELAYSRTAEAEADALAVAWLRTANIDPGVAAGFFDRLAEKDPAQFVLLSTHPASESRGAVFRDGAQPGRAVLTAAEWSSLKAICSKKSYSDE